MTTNIERREFSRSPVEVEVRAIKDDAFAISGISRDISAHGLFVMCERHFHMGVACSLRIMLSKDKIVRAQGRVIRVERSGMGIAFDGIDIDGFEDLKQLVRQNSKDPDKADQEFSRHKGIKNT